METQTTDIFSQMEGLGPQALLVIGVVAIVLLVVAILLLVVAIRYYVNGGTYFKRMTEHLEEEEYERSRRARQMQRPADDGYEEAYDDGGENPQNRQ